MASGLPGGAQLPFQLPSPPLGSGIAAAEPPFPIGIIEPWAQAQPTRHCPGTRQSTLGIQEITHQAPGAGGGGLLQRRFQNRLLLRQRQLPQQVRSAGHALCPQNSWGTLTQQEQASLLGQPSGFQVPGQHLHRRTTHHGAILPATDRQGELAEATIRACRQPIQGQGCPTVVEGSGGGPPLQQEPLHPLGARARPIAIEHGESAIGRPAAEQHLGVGQHHRQGLGSRAHLEKPLLQQAQTRGVVFLKDPSAPQVEPLQVVILQQRLKGVLT